VSVAPVKALKRSNVDLVLVLDTSGDDMIDELQDLRDILPTLIDEMKEMTDSLRIAIVSYQDFPFLCETQGTYLTSVDLSFTSDTEAVESALDAVLTQVGGCSNDDGDAVFSGVAEALHALDWRPATTKTMIVVGNSAPLVVDDGDTDEANSVEPVSGISAATLIEESIAMGIQINAIDVGRFKSNGEITRLATRTGGIATKGISSFAATLADIMVDSCLDRPMAWLGTSYVATPGTLISFDASGTYDPNGIPIKSYRWDFDGDGRFDKTTAKPYAKRKFNEPFEGTIVLQVINVEGYESLGSAHVVVNREGSVRQTDGRACEIGEDGYPIIASASEGSFLNCRAERMPRKDKAGVEETGEMPAEECLDKVIKTCKCVDKRDDKSGSDIFCLTAVFEEKCAPYVSEARRSKYVKNLKARWKRYCKETK